MNPEAGMSWEDAVQSLRERPEARALVEACYFDDPLLAAAERYRASSEWAAVRKWIGLPPGKALDLGAGRGIAAYAFAKDGWTTTALEPDASELVGAGAIRSLADAASLAINITESWGEKLPYSAAHFDVVHCRQALHHARDLKQLCAEIGRVLKPGGVLIATREHVISRREDLPIFLASHPLHKLYGGENAYLLSEYLDAIRGAGIDITRCLNPRESDINLHPETTGSVKRRIAGRFGLPDERWIPDFALKFAGAISTAPGRIYTFVGRKRGARA